MPDVVSFAELDEQHVELLPPRTLLTAGLSRPGGEDELLRQFFASVLSDSSPRLPL